MHGKTYIRYKIKNKHKGGETSTQTLPPLPPLRSPTDSIKNLDTIYGLYDVGYEPPYWAKEKLKEDSFYMKYAPHTKVYYPESSILDTVKKLTIEREPVNM